jgi:hypothetical protein
MQKVVTAHQFCHWPKKKMGFSPWQHCFSVHSAPISLSPHYPSLKRVWNKNVFKSELVRDLSFHLKWTGIISKFEKYILLITFLFYGGIIWYNDLSLFEGI